VCTGFIERVVLAVEERHFLEDHAIAGVSHLQLNVQQTT
jgi:hypothetical protein